MTELKQVRMEVHKLRVGMYVAALDRPWTETPFPLQGFLIKTPQQMIALKRFCQSVYIDVRKSNLDDKFNMQRLQVAASVASQRDDADSQVAVTEPKLTAQSLEIDHSRYQRHALSEREILHAEDAYRRVEVALSGVYKQLKEGAVINPDNLRDAADHMVDSVISCPNSFQWMLKIKKHDGRLFDHALRSSCWGLVCARHIGMDELNLKALALGLLLKDVGRVELQKLKRSDPEAAKQSNFIELGVAYLRRNNVSAKVLSVIKYHCERFDGTGNPYGISGTQIPVLARLAGIATYYDRLVYGVRKEDRPVAPSAAAKQLYDQRDKAFQEDLVIEFIEAIGLYPMGTMVELNTGELAIVSEQDPKRRLKPKVMVVRNPSGKKLDDMRCVDLHVSHAQKVETLQNGRFIALEEHATKIVSDLAQVDGEVDFELVRAEFLEATASMVEEEEAPKRSFLSKFLPAFQTAS